MTDVNTLQLRGDFYDAISAERERQDEKWGYPQNNTFAEWGSYLAEECGEAVQQLNDLNIGVGDEGKLREELVQTAAMCLSILEHMERTQLVTGALRKARNDEAVRDIFNKENYFSFKMRIDARALIDACPCETESPSAYLFESIHESRARFARFNVLNVSDSAHSISLSGNFSARKGEARSAMDSFTQELRNVLHLPPDSILWEIY